LRSIRQRLAESIRRILKAQGYVIARFPNSTQAPLDVRRSGNDPRSMAYTG
jgi:hypothetical protein